jgi:hypothetical protein
MEASSKKAKPTDFSYSGESVGPPKEGVSS